MPGRTTAESPIESSLLPTAAGGVATLRTRLSADDKERRAPSQGRVGFHDILHQSIVEGMTNVLGQSGMQAALYHLELDQHGENPKEFHESLRKIFKDGATTLEKVIVKEFYRTLDLPYMERERFDFEEHVNLAMQAGLSRLRGRVSP